MRACVRACVCECRWVKGYGKLAEISLIKVLQAFTSSHVLVTHCLAQSSMTVDTLPTLLQVSPLTCHCFRPSTDLLKKRKSAAVAKLK